MDIDAKLFCDVKLEIKKLGEDFFINKGIILNESDLHCRVFNKLFCLFTHNQSTFNENIKGSPLHSEIRFFDSNRKLMYKPDLTIIDTKNYEVHGDVDSFRFIDDGLQNSIQRKGYSFTKPFILIELKFIKKRSNISFEKVKDDLEKMQSIKQLNGNKNIYLILVIFSKYDIEQEFEHWQNSETIRTIIKNNEISVIYRSSYL